MSLFRQPADSPRTRPRSSWVLGGWTASSPSVSSLTIRPRGKFLPRASVSRHAASAFRRPSTAGLRLGSLSRFHASSGAKAKLDGSASRSISSSSQAPRPFLRSLSTMRGKIVGEMGDVGDRIVDLALVERAAAPVGEARALVEAVAEQRFDQVRIADLLAVAERHRRDLRVEQRDAAPCRSDCGRSPGPGRRRGRPSARRRSRPAGRAAAPGRCLGHAGRSPRLPRCVATWIRHSSGQ